MSVRRNGAVSAESINRLHTGSGKQQKGKRDTVTIGDRVVVQGKQSGIMRFFGNVSGISCPSLREMPDVPLEDARILALPCCPWREVVCVCAKCFLELSEGREEEESGIQCVGIAPHGTDRMLRKPGNQCHGTPPTPPIHGTLH